MEILDRLKDPNEKDLIYFGDLIHEFKKTEVGVLIEQVIMNKILNELAVKGKDEDAAEVLGKLRGFRDVLSEIESFEIARNNAIKSKKKKRTKKKEEWVDTNEEPTMEG